MSKKKHPEHVNHERWLVSYADFITLLFAFFVVLFASGQTDKRKQIKLAESMQSAFKFNGIFDPHTHTPPISDDGGTSTLPTASPLTLPIPTAADPQDIQAATTLRIHEILRNQPTPTRPDGKIPSKIPDNAIILHPSPEGLVVSLREAGFFDSGSAEVREQAIPILNAVAAALPHQPMRIEGHTDDVPIHTTQFATNWELSTARAATITRLLIAQHAVSPTQVSATGYAEFHPTAPNTTEAGRAQNRRVDIVLLNPPPEKSTPEKK